MSGIVRTKAAATKNHLQENAKFYGAVAVGTAVAATAAYFGARNATTAGPEIALKVQQLGHHNTAVILNVIERSTPSKPVLLVGTNQVFNSLSEAARLTGHHLSQLSKHVNGQMAAMPNGDVFQLLEVAA